MRPSRERFEAFKEAEREAPVVMLNLLRFRTLARYADGRGTDWSGQRAYREYEQAIAPTLARAGGKVLWRGTVGAVLIGDEDWDEAILVSYPSGAAFAEMIESTEYQSIHAHREAALADSRLLAVTEQMPGAGVKGT